MKRKDIFNYVEHLNNVSDLKGVKFAYSVLKNKKRLEEEIKILEEIIKPSDEFLKYEQERIALCNKYAEKDDIGKAVIENNQFKIPNMEDFNKELDLLKAEKLEILSERDKQISEYNLMLEEEITIEFSKLNFNDLPNDISAEQLEKIDFMINME